MAARNLALLSGIFLAFSVRSLAQPKGQGMIGGVVIDQASGDPVRKAIVTVTWHGTPRSWATLQTDASGRFRFEGLPPGTYDLRAVKQGVGTAIYGAKDTREMGELITLAAGEIRDGLRLTFIHAASISGRVLDPDGDPVPGSVVMLLRPTRDLGERVLVNGQGATADQRGDYRLTGIDPGEYYLVATTLTPASRPGQMLAQEYYGGARDSKDASPIKIRAGESVAGVDFHLVSEAPAQIQGRVTGVPEDLGPTEERNIVAGPKSCEGRSVMVSITPIGERQPRNMGNLFAPCPDYAFKSPDLPAGRYRIEAAVHGSGKTYAASQLIDLHPGTIDIPLPLVPAVDIKGQLRVEGSDKPGALEVMLARPGARPIFAHAGADGKFTLAQVPPGEWELSFNQIPRGAFLKSALLGDKDARFTRLEIESGAEPTLNIVISMNSAKIEGEIDALGGDPARAGVLLAPTGKYHDLARFYYSASADEKGKFKLNGIAPGKYKIFALENMAAANFRNPEAADQLDQFGQEIELEEGATLTVHPKLIPTERAREALP